MAAGALPDSRMSRSRHEPGEVFHSFISPQKGFLRGNRKVVSEPVVQNMQYGYGWLKKSQHEGWPIKLYWKQCEQCRISSTHREYRMLKHKQ
ncbi:hypothetical protein DPO11_11020 [Salmonella enterica]|nr:hypothetical protein [Salmonella enterica]